MGSCGAGRAVGWEPPRCGAELSEKLLLPYASPELSWLRSLEGCAWKKCPACGRPHAAWLGVACSACLAARRKYVWFCPEWGRAPQAPGKHSFEAGGWVPGEQLWVFFSEDRLQLRFWGSCAVPCHLRVSVDEMGTAPCSEAGAVPLMLAASEPLPITLKKIPQGFFLSALGRRWHPAHPNGDRAAYLRRGRRPGPHYQRPQPHHSPRLGLSELCRAGGGSETSPGQGARRV